MNEVNSKLGPSHAIKPAIKNSFYINEQRQYIPQFVEPDDEANKRTETGKHVMDYLKYYKDNPTYIEAEN